MNNGDIKKTIKIDNHIIDIFYNKINNIVVIYYNYNNNQYCKQLFYDSYNDSLLYGYNAYLTNRQKSLLLKKIKRLKSGV